MTAPNIETSSTKRQLGWGGPDGVAIDAVPRTNSKQAPVRGTALAGIFSFNANGGTLSQTAANTAANQTITAEGVLATDFALGLSKPTSQANLGIGGLAISANDTFDVNLCTSNGAVTATADQTYSITALRGYPVISANFTPSAVVTKTAVEQVFTITPTSATAAASITNGAVTQVSVSDGGANYYAVPTVVFTAASGGTGAGASGIAIVSGGAVVGVQITDGGSGYSAAPTVSFVGGNDIAPGMAVAMTKAAYQANLGIGGVRVAGKNQIGVQYFNVSAANITPTANETYKIVAFNGMSAASPTIQITANLANLTAAAANASNKTDITVVGIATTDMFLNMNKALASPLLFGNGLCTANTVTIHYGAGVPGATPANGVYSMALLKQDAPAPVQVSHVTLTPSAVAANSAAEQVFTLPTGVTLQANSTVIVNKRTATPGVAIVGARANSTSTLAINFMNVTGAAITPPANEVYTVVNCPSYAPSLSANQLAGYCAQVVKPAQNWELDLVNETQQTLQLLGGIKGA